MAWTSVGSLVFVWWNTSLAPPVVKRKADDEDLQFVVEQVRRLRQDTLFDLLALGEVNDTDLATIVDGVGDPALAVHDATDRTGRIKFDTAVIYDRNKLSLRDNQSIVDKYGPNSLKTGEVVEFSENRTGEIFRVVVSHWPSRLTAADGAPVRAELGIALRASLSRMRESGGTPFHVLMGDYNDDPFSPSLASHLLATRDRALARRGDMLLYNPFWRWIGESHDDVSGEREEGICGTHFYSKGATNRWFTYDQIIFSSAFLNDQAMVLNEPRCGILVPSELRTKVLRRDEIFDHLPVIATVDLRSQS